MLSKHLLAPLAGVAQLVFLDQRACGRSDDCDPSLWTLDTWIDDVPAVCEALELSWPILLGRSFGGFVALGIAARDPELPAKLIIRGPEPALVFARGMACRDVGRLVVATRPGGKTALSPTPSHR